MLPYILLLASLGSDPAHAASGAEQLGRPERPAAAPSSAAPRKSSTKRPSSKPPPAGSPKNASTPAAKPAVPAARPAPSRASGTPTAPSTSRPASTPRPAAPPQARGASAPAPDRPATDDRAWTPQTPRPGGPAASGPGTRPTASPTASGAPARAAGPPHRAPEARPDGQGPSRAAILDREPPRLGDRPTGGTRPYAGTPDSRLLPPHRTSDHRFARPSHLHVHTHPAAHYHVPVHSPYRPLYTRWYVHPYYRWTYSTTVVVSLGFTTYAWVDGWVPPMRAGWFWVPGYWSFGWWQPGYWAPVAPAPVQYVYVPGWWEADHIYVDGYYRVAERDDWAWVDGYYLEDGTYVRGHWIPTGEAPEGYLWEPGFYDGEVWVDGFWRPEFRPGFTWVSSYFDEDGVLRTGYWQPIEDRRGHVWIPGWFDGNTWVDGYWVTSEAYEETDPNAWAPEQGWDDGWEVGDGDGEERIRDNRSPDGRSRAVNQEELPLALPVAPPVGVED